MISQGAAVRKDVRERGAPVCIGPVPPPLPSTCGRRRLRPDDDRRGYTHVHESVHTTMACTSRRQLTSLANVLHRAVVCVRRHGLLPFATQNATLEENSSWTPADRLEGLPDKGLRPTRGEFASRRTESGLHYNRRRYRCNCLPKCTDNTVPGSKDETHIDLQGASHFDKATGVDIPTPHVQTRKINVAPNGMITTFKKMEVARVATKQDVRVARELARRQGLCR